MNSIALAGIAEMKMITEPEPVISRDDDVLIRVSHMGVCGSDIHYYRTGKIGVAVVDFPFVLGHEGAGIVEDMGPAVKGLQKGQRIMIEPAVSCHKCDQCLAGRPHTCRNLTFLGLPGQSPGLLSDYIVMPERACFPVPDHLSNELAVMSEPLSIAIWGCDLAGVEEGMKIGILGSGPIGMCVQLYCRFLGVEDFYVTDILDYRLDMAKAAGEVWTGNPDKTDIVKDILGKVPEGLDMVFDCCGMQEVMPQAIDLVTPGGKIMIIGIPEFENWIVSADLTRRKEICIQNVRRQNERLQKALDLIADGSIDMSPLITHCFPFSRTGEAFDMVANYNDGVMKAIVEVGN